MIQKKYIALGLLISFSISAEFMWVPFHESMQKYSFRDIVSKPPWKNIFDLCAVQFECVQEAFWRQQNRPRSIPKIIHQIWLGKKPIPEECTHYMKTWKEHHPDWQYYLWTDADCAQFNFFNQYLFDKAINPGEKSDIWRYEILEHYGGVYVDIDMECVKSLDELHEMFDFYVGLQPLDTGYVQLGIGIIGACPHHPILQHAIQALPSQEKEHQIIVKTGPLFFTRIVCTHLLQHNSGDIVLPASYFYPRGYNDTVDARDVWLKPESYTIHHWAGSWLKP